MIDPLEQEDIDIQRAAGQRLVMLVNAHILYSQSEEGSADEESREDDFLTMVAALVNGDPEFAAHVIATLVMALTATVEMDKLQGFISYLAGQLNEAEEQLKKGSEE